MTKIVTIGPGENNYETKDMTADEITEMENRITANANALAAQKTNAESGNQKLLDKSYFTESLIEFPGH